jgi:hypothetical protein
MNGDSRARSPTAKHTIKQNATNILYMTSLKRRGCDREKFGTTTTEFGAMVGKLCLK